MKTIFIYDELEGDLKFFKLDGDYSHLDGCYVNSVDTSDELQDVLIKLLYTDDTMANYRVLMLYTFPRPVDDFVVVRCGWIP